MANAKQGWTLTNPRLHGSRRWLVAFGSEFRFVRRFLGGHWELWLVEPCQRLLWLDTDRCSCVARTRPPACFGTPLCEDYP